MFVQPIKYQVENKLVSMKTKFKVLEMAVGIVTEKHIWPSPGETAMYGKELLLEI